MGRINVGRVILGGLVAGLVINVAEAILNMVIVRDTFAAIMREHGLDPEGGSVVVWILYGFLWGILAVWLYAAIRPRFGPGPKTAIVAAVTVWFLSSFLGNVAMMNMGLIPASLAMLGMGWGLAELGIATLVGASLYKEEGVSQASIPERMSAG